MKAVLALSGGMDSSTLLIYLLSRGYEVKTITINYGQKHDIEIERAMELIRYLGDKMPVYNAHFLTFPMQDLLSSSALVKGGEDVPEGHYEDENMKKTVVPNRNKIFSSIIQAAALSWANETGDGVMIAMGIHAGDHAIYPDCRQEFRDADYQAFLEGNWGGTQVTYFTPFLDIDKHGILIAGQQACKKLGIDFNEVYKRTNTSYKPIYHKPEGCEQCKPKAYSDYKSASSVERIEAFIKLGVPDPVGYADETGPVKWEVAKAHVEKVLADG
jgi:7-cyano-7-deazaguanine synthase